MLKALMWKELRETGWIALIALAAYLALVASETGHSILPFLGTGNVAHIPFLDGMFMTHFCYVSVCLAVVLGLTQTVWESRSGTWLFLMHRPTSRRRILGVKLAVGGGLYLAYGALAILAYALWAATPGTHASPFQWWMTADAWRMCAGIGLLYLGAFLAGLRPARWFGTRLFPLFAAGIIATLLLGPEGWLLLRSAVLPLVAVCLIVLIDFAGHARDFS